MGAKGENSSNKDTYVFNTITSEWKYIITRKFPEDRSEFGWIRLDKAAILFGGVSLPSELLYNDMWIFRYDGYDFNSNSTNEISKDYWSELSQYVIKDNIGRKAG